MSNPRKSSQRRPVEDLDRLAELFQRLSVPRPYVLLGLLLRPLDLDEDDCAFLINDMGLTGLAAELLPVLERVTAAARGFASDGPAPPAPAPTAAPPAADSDDEDSDTALARHIVMGAVRRAADRIAPPPAAPPAPAAAPPAPAAAPPAPPCCSSPSRTSAAAANADDDDDLASRMEGVDFGYRIEADGFDATRHPLGSKPGLSLKIPAVLRTASVTESAVGAKALGLRTSCFKGERSAFLPTTGSTTAAPSTKVTPSLAAAQAAFDYASVRGLVGDNPQPSPSPAQRGGQPSLRRRSRPLPSIFLHMMSFEYSLLTPVHLKFLSSWVLLQSSVFVDDAVQSPTLFTSKWSVIEWHRHACRLLLTLMGRKAKYTEQELLGRRAQSAWGVSPTEQGEGKRKSAASDAGVSGQSIPNPILISFQDSSQGARRLHRPFEWAMQCGRHNIAAIILTHEFDTTQASTARLGYSEARAAHGLYQAPKDIRPAKTGPRQQIDKGSGRRILAAQRKAGEGDSVDWSYAR
ncbi:hypothetical protein R3P38DRAFT_2794573 [Favolaschia claudopus]|uniref:Uncharacterized protein n=1 Tax=Favolaschia claudopus TaxID=2862362 RepID=A0AAW0AC29_9AGAR